MELASARSIAALASLIYLQPRSLTRRSRWRSRCRPLTARRRVLPGDHWCFQAAAPLRAAFGSVDDGKSADDIHSVLMKDLRAIAGTASAKPNGGHGESLLVAKCLSKEPSASTQQQALYVVLRDIEKRKRKLSRLHQKAGDDEAVNALVIEKQMLAVERPQSQQCDATPSPENRPCSCPGGSSGAGTHPLRPSPARSRAPGGG